MRRLINVLFLAALTSIPAWSQSTSVTATITDTDGQTWNNGTGTATFVPGNPQNYHWPGGTIPNQVSFAMNGSGTFTVSLPDNTTISPLGSAWNFSICPNASSPCVSKQITLSGTTLNLSTQLSSVAIGPRFPATPLAYGYLDKEISPTPIQGAFYWNVTTLVSRQWTGTIWQNLAGGGGGGGTPSGPPNSFQLANASLNGFISDTNFLLDNTTHTATLGGNTVTQALLSIPKLTFDPMDTRFQGGLAAAIAGTSGFTPTQVLQYTADYAWCYTHINSPVLIGSRVAVPSGYTINVAGIKLWPNQELSGESSTNHSYFQHSDNTQIMVSFHSNTDTVTCPQNSTTYTPGGAAGGSVRNIGISGIGNSVNDIGIEMNCVSCRVQNITGFGNGFGGQALLMLGTSVFADHIGYEGAQVKGCQVYVTGGAPVSSSPTGQCGAIEDDTLDGEFDYGYSTDGAQFLSGHGPGSCTVGKCAGFIFGGQNGHVNHVFSQISDLCMVATGSNVRINDTRCDASSLTGITVLGGDVNIEGATVLSPCTSTTLQSNYNAGTATGCYGATSGGGGGFNGGNYFTNVNVGASGIFPTTFIQARLSSGPIAGASADYFTGLILGNADNATSNDWPIIFQPGGGGPAPLVPFMASSQGTAHGALANIAGVGVLYLGSSTPLNQVIGGIPGQIVTIYASFGQGTATVNSNPSGTGVPPNGIITCTGLPEKVTSTVGLVMQYTINNLSELGCNTQTNFVHLNWAGNPTVTNPSIADFYGNAQARQYPPFSIDVSQLHGPTTGSSACFEQDAVFADGSHVTSALACTNVNLATMTPGEIFVQGGVPQAAAYNLYLVSNAQGNGVATGLFPGPTSGFWNYTVIAAGGDGSTPPSANDNNTGEFWAPFGILLNTPGTQPTCSIEYRGLTWVVQGSGPTSDSFQICERISTGAYQWTTPGGGGGTFTGAVTVGSLALASGSTTNLAASHISETSNPGNETITQSIILNDGGAASGQLITEGNAIAGAALKDSFWSDSGITNGVPGLMANENNSGAKSIVQIATPGTSGDGVKLAANGKDIVDNGPDGSNFTPTKVCGTGCGTGGTSTLSTGANDNNGWLTINTGTSPVAGAGIVTVTFGGTYSAARKCMVEPANALAWGLANNSMIVTTANSTATNFIITAANGASLAASSTYIVFYRCGK